MKLTAKLAFNQLKINRNRSIMTLIGIVLSSAMLTAVCGFVASTMAVFEKAIEFARENTNYNPGAVDAALIVIGCIFGAVIISAAVIVISNSFRISASERTRQFGILKSAGATKKQIATSVLYEGIFLSTISIPIGIIIGLLIHFFGITIIENLMISMSNGGTLNLASEELLNIPFVTPPLMFVIAILVSFGTVILSAWLPARKAAKIPAIDAIRGSGEIKIKPKKMRANPIVSKLFGFEGSLASKSLKRSRRAFRATVLSLTISVALVVLAGGFEMLMKETANLMFENIEATVEADWASETRMTFGDNGEVSKVEFETISNETVNTISEKFREFDNTPIYGVGGNRRYQVTLPDGTKEEGALVVVDSVNYEKICKAARVPLGSNILVNNRREMIDGVKTEYAPYNLSEFMNKTIKFEMPGQDTISLKVDGEITGQNVSAEIPKTHFSVIVPKLDAICYFIWYANAKDDMAFVDFSNQVLNEYAPKSQSGIQISSDSMSIASVTKQLNDMINTMLLFIYGFVGMLTLIAITSVISTISTNIASRTREFAVLQSVGMTKAAIRKMLNLESILCSFRALIFGVPIGVLGTWGIYLGMGLVAEQPFSFPWIPILQCIFGVFIITWVTMQYSASKIRNDSIIEAIRGE